jgi:hypothetical protein
MNITLCDRNIEVDDLLGQLIPTLDGRWYSVGKTRPILSMTPRRTDSFVLGLQKKNRAVTLNHMAWWHATGHWPIVGEELIYHIGAADDYRFENLQIRDPEYRTQALRAVTPAATPVGGISELPNGQFKVRAYDPVTKVSKYVGLRNTREDAIELKRAFLAGEATFRSPSA